MIFAVIDTNVIVAALLTQLVTGNLKHFPNVGFVVTPAQLCEIIGV